MTTNHRGAQGAHPQSDRPRHRRGLDRLRLVGRASVLAALVATAAAPAAAQVAAPPPGGPSYIFGIGDIVLDPANLARNVQHYVARVQQMDMQRRQLQGQLDALRKLPSPNWRNLGQLAQQLDHLAAQADGIAYSLTDAGRTFREVFPGHAIVLQRITPATARMQAARTLGTLQGVMSATSAHGRDMQSAMVTLNALKSRMYTTVGAQQAMELQTTMAGYQADQLGMLRQAVVMQTGALAVVEAQRLQQQATADMVQEQAAARLSGYRPMSTGGIDGRKTRRTRIR